MYSIEVASLGLEGGGAQVGGRVVDGEWRFAQSGSAMDMDEDDNEFWNSWRKDEVSDVGKALPDIWAIMYPVKIHPHFIPWFRAAYASAVWTIPEHLRESHLRNNHNQWATLLGCQAIAHRWIETGYDWEAMVRDVQQQLDSKALPIPVPLQNRVTPFGEIIAYPARGTMMGNRGGCLHDDQKRLTTRR